MKFIYNVDESIKVLKVPTEKPLHINVLEQKAIQSFKADLQVKNCIYENIFNPNAVFPDGGSVSPWPLSPEWKALRGSLKHIVHEYSLLLWESSVERNEFTPMTHQLQGTL